MSFMSQPDALMISKRLLKIMFTKLYPISPLFQTCFVSITLEILEHNYIVHILVMCKKMQAGWQTVQTDLHYIIQSV